MGWSDRARVLTVFTMGTQAGEDGERTAFKRRLGTTIAEFRGALAESQQDLADALDVDVETVGRWERGVREPKIYDLNRIMRRYSIPPEWLLEPTDSVTERDARAAQLRQAAMEAALGVVAVEQGRRADVGKSPRRGKSQA